MPEPLFQRLALIGIGLIGSSLARITRQRDDIAAELVAHDSSPDVLARVAALGIADRIAFLYQGRIHAEGAPVHFQQTADPVVRQFVDGRSEGPMRL